MQFYKKHYRLCRRLVDIFVPIRSMRRKIQKGMECPDGICAYLRMVRRMWRDDAASLQKFKSFLSVVAIVKDEGPYFKEWLEYHIMQGVDKFYVYDNESSDNTLEILKPYIDSGVVEYKYFPGKRQQLAAYTDAIETYKNDTRWMTFIDLDEFILPVRQRRVVDLLRAVSPRVGQIALPWLFFGANGHETRPDGPVIAAYTKCARRGWQRKSIFNPRLALGAFVHVGDNAGRTMYPSRKKLRVNHYYCKSWQEYQRRKTRGDVLHGDAFAQNTFHRADFEKHNYNEVDDTYILRYVPELLKRMAK